MLDSEYCIILAYPHGASGKFLINCLCMNKEFCPQVPINTLLALHQENIQQEFILKKLQTFINENPNTFEWNDLSFGDSSFFNVDNFDTHLLDQRQEFLEYSLEGLKKSICVKYATRASRYFFRVLHKQEQYLFYKEIWKNAKIIEMINCEQWIKHRNNNSNALVKYPDEFNSLLILSSHKFNCLSFLDRDFFIEEYTQLLSHFNVPIKNIDKVQSMYNLYVPYIIGK